ncbi:hypothetical protein ACHAPJ_005233 [Fusarium lateritium]
MASEQPFIEVHQKTSAYKHMWARDVAQATMNYDLKGAIDLVKESPKVDADIPKEIGIGQLREATKEITGAGYIPREEGQIDVGIVGAGVAGLFAALLFDWLNDHPNLKDKKLKIKYDILEAAGAERLGGRLYTHHFSDEEHDYYDVGAMRFPNNSIMKRTFQLFQYIGLTQESKPGLIPYYLKDVLDKCPSYVNDISHTGNVWASKRHPDDPYEVNKGLPCNGKIPKELLTIDPGKLVSEALGVFMKEVKEKFKLAIAEEDDEKKKAGKQEAKDSEKKEAPRSPRAQELWDLLMRADHMSVRQFLGSGTGWYDQSLTECVLEELDFHTDDMDKNPATEGNQYWWCVDGGAQEIAKRMAAKAKKRVEYNTCVRSIDAQVSLRKADKFTAMKLHTVRTDPKTKKVESKDREYFAILNSTTLAALQRMELRNAGLSWGTKQAIRALGYGASAKVGMKFRTAWWQKDPFGIKQGGVSRTDLPLRVCVYPSYNIEENEGPDKWDPEKPAVLLCSYTWGQDAQRLGSLCANNTAHDDKELKRLIIHDLARLHAREEFPFEKLVEHLEEQYIDHHGYDWYRDEHMSGAFAYFGPGQFSNMWQEIIKPNSFGQLYLVGEAASSHHAWIVGALESVIRAVYVMFQGLQNGNPKFEEYRIVLDLLKQAPTDKDEKYEFEDIGEPLKRGGAMPTGLPFHPLPEEMPTTQFCATKDAPLTGNPTDEAKHKEVEMTYGAALAVLSLIESFFELGVDKQ